MHETAAALLEAHVQHVLADFQGARFNHTTEVLATETLAWLRETSLHQICDSEMVLGVIRRYVIEFRISGGITELAGEMAARVFTSRHNDTTCLRDIISANQVEELVDELASVGQARRREIAQLVADSPTCTAVVVGVLERGIRDAVLGRKQPSPPVGASVVATLARNLARKWVPDLERRVQTRIAHYLETKNARMVEDTKRYIADVLDERCIRGLADEIWETFAPMRLSDLFAYLGKYDLDDFVILCYEFWLQFRNTEYFQSIVEELVAHFFAKYGDKTVWSLIEDMGVTQSMIVHELRELTTRLREHALATGFMERQVRAQLESFYQSEAVQELLAP